ncbi:MAG: hypothetical protein IKM30_01700 [Oscillospiraceae bacterium]|nr:hypothetical protein [Oscillospiraceae bacterium]
MAGSLLTGDKIVRLMRRRNGWAAVGYCFFALFAVLMLIAGPFLLNDGRPFPALAAVVMGILLMVYAGKRLFSAIKTVFRTEKHRLFRKYGSPDDLAAQILQGEEEMILDHPQVMVTEQFIMKRKCFESFIPYDHILLIYRKEHRTNGVLDGIYLVIHDCYGDSYEYPFRMGQKYAGDLEYAAGEIGKRASGCRFGYTTENLNWAKANVKPLPEA